MESKSKRSNRPGWLQGLKWVWDSIRRTTAMSNMNQGTELSVEQGAYDRLREELSKRGLNGKWIVIVGSEQRAICDDPEEAFSRGVEAVGAGRPFFMKQIGSDEANTPPTLFLELLHGTR